jgi:hypothetical protein
MPLATPTLKQQIIDAFEAQMTKTENPEAAINDLADKLSKAIEAFVKSGDVNTTVTGACATPAGPGTISGTGTGTIN